MAAANTDYKGMSVVTDFALVFCPSAGTWQKHMPTLTRTAPN